MVVFDSLNISEDGKGINIVAHIGQEAYAYYDNVSINNITIVLADDVAPASSTPSSQYIYKKTFEEELGEFTLFVDKASFDEAYINYSPTTEGPIDPSKPYASKEFLKSTLSEDLFFVYVECTAGDIKDCPPCGEDELISLGVTFDEKILYNGTMQYTRELANTCQVPVGFIDYILLWHAFKAAIETGNYSPGIKFFKMLQGMDIGNINSSTKRKCGCHG